MKTTKIAEKKFIDFAYKASFSNDILAPFTSVVKSFKSKGKDIIFNKCLNNQVVQLKSIKGSLEEWMPHTYANNPWIDIILEEGYLRDDILPLYKKMITRPQSYLNHSLGNIILFEIGNTYFIMDGHKRIALARFFYEFYQLPDFLTDVKIVRCDFEWSEYQFSSFSPNFETQIYVNA